MTKILTIFCQKFLVNADLQSVLTNFCNKINLFTKIPQRLKNPYYRDV
ncbi:hypothetical protein EV00_0344 [Prochlorococcus marinus str. MIT 9322]|nr:hypothetical protein EV00_0344 [Prochlorococcus marinus str. MIT 9322]